ncbi:hypothetical protein MMC10_010551 [Thelotrema lepadinum]|nr:hypothetical protein [Thelotrema lepadinum]
MFREQYAKCQYHVATRWVPVPETAQLQDQTRTSAFINIQMPLGPSNNTTTVIYTCSVDARWAMGTNKGGPIGYIDVEYVQSATIKNTRPPEANMTGHSFNFLPVDDGTWRRVRMDLDWLNTLTPPLSTNDSVSDFTSLSALITAVGLDNSTGLIIEWENGIATLEVVIAALVTNGLSRQGYTANVGTPQHISDRDRLVPWTSSPDTQSSIIAGTYSFPSPSPDATTARPAAATELTLSITAAGYAYKADSAAYFLALTVLFAHAALALGHILYLCLFSRITSEAWDSLVGLLLLAIVSGKRTLTTSSGGSGSQTFPNAGAWVERYRTFSTRAGVRAVPSQTIAAKGNSSNNAHQTGKVEEDVALLFGDALGNGMPALKVGEKYG